MTKSFIKQLFVIAMLVSSVHALAADQLISVGVPGWNYLNDGSDQGTAWQAEAFTEVGWSPIPNPYYLLNSNSTDITSYFRQGFSVADPAAYESLSLTLYRDDGAVVYINGSEVYRDNMPVGAIAYDTLASTEVTAPTTPVSATLPNNVLHSGSNVIAVEVHQFSNVSKDLTLAVQLSGNPPVTRGPYLQMITPTSAVIRWRTVSANDTKVNYGVTSGSLTSNVSDPALTTEHEIQLSGLTPATTYYYDIGTITNVLSSGSDHFFKTQPAVGTHTPTHIWVIGDSGKGSADQRAVYNGYLNRPGKPYTDLWLMLGDNAYYNGTDGNYQDGFFDIYPSLMHQTVVWPTLGNHDGYGVDTNVGTGPYYDIFTLPQAAELGGFPSGTESYYSYNYGNIHFIVLDSFDVDRGTTASMATWLENDLNATTADWIIAYWHHPPYSKGSHNSDTEDSNDSASSSTAFSSFGAMRQMRENILPILEQHGVDLVLCGHSHSYERSKFVDGHYGKSDTYSDAIHALNTGSGDINTGSTAYTKAYPSVAHGGTVYAVAGTSASADGGALNHPVMYRSLNELGSLMIDIDNLALSARFINQNGDVHDAFTLQKLSSGPDQDGDSIDNASDNCPQVANLDQLNTDGDTQGNACDTDDDNDLMPDTWEIQYGLNPLVNDASGDSDSDGFTNLQEYTRGTNPLMSNVANDFDGNGTSDVLLRNMSTGDWNLAQLNGLTVSNQGSVPAFTDIENIIVSTADFNGDGKADILTRGTASGFLPGTFHVDLISGMSVIDSNWLFTMSIDLNDEVMSTKDFNKDGKADVLLRNKISGVWKINYMNGVSDPTTATLNATLDTCYTMKGDGDYDGNGYPDLLLRKDICGGATYPWLVYTTDGDNTVLGSGVPTGLTQNTGWGALVTDKDFNADGKADVLTRALTGSPQQWLLANMNGTGAVTSNALNIPVQSMWQFADDGDFNGDGKDDILLRSTNTGQWFIDLLDNATVIGSGVPNTYINLIWNLQAIDDYNGDGMSDFLLRNSATGLWYMNLMNGVTVQSKGAPAITFDLGYELQND